MANITAATALLFTLVVVASALPHSGTIFECTSEGRFADPFDCTSFFTCVTGSDGSLARSKGDCKGFAFHPDLQTCVNPSQVPGCGSRKSKQLTSDPTLSLVCTVSSFVCSDCKTVVNCIRTEGYRDSTCPAGYSCSEAGSGGLAGSAACLPNDRADAECTCTSDDLNQPKPDPNTVNSFIFCPADGGEAQAHKCPQGLQYNATKKHCVSADGSPVCSQEGTFAFVNCSGTYTCLPTSNGFIKSILLCEQGMMASASNPTCSDPCGWPKANHVCTAEGRFKEPSDCSKFVTCNESPLGAGMFNKTTGVCPENLVWDETAAGELGHCVDADTVTCSPVTPNTCPIDNLVCPEPSFRDQLRDDIDETDKTIQKVIKLMWEEFQ